MTALSPGHHQIHGYDVERVQDGDTVSWEVFHPEHGLVGSQPNLGLVRHWIRQHPMSSYSPERDH